MIQPSKIWIVAYAYSSDTFTVTTLDDYLPQAQRAFRSGALYDESIVSVHETQSAASEQCEAFQCERDRVRVSPEERAAGYLRRVVLGLGEAAYNRVVNGP